MNQKVIQGYYISEIKQRAEKSQSHFFDADTMRFFSSRISQMCYKVNNDIYFFTSERDNGVIKHKGSQRAWTIRKIDQNGKIDSISEFQEHQTLRKAHLALLKILGVKA